MATKIFVNLPVNDLKKSMDFFTKLGFSTEVLVCLSCESRDNVNELVRKAVAAGGTTYNQPQDHGFMYGHGFQDLDGHICELIYMESSAVK